MNIKFKAIIEDAQGKELIVINLGEYSHTISYDLLKKFILKMENFKKEIREEIENV